MLCFEGNNQRTERLGVILSTQGKRAKSIKTFVQMLPQLSAESLISAIFTHQEASRACFVG